MDLNQELEKAFDEAERGAKGSVAQETGEGSRDPSGISGGVKKTGPSRGNWGFLILLLGLGAAVLVLLFSGVDGAAIYSVTTSELVTNVEKYEGRTVRVEGDLVKGSLRYRADPCEYRFSMEHEGKVLKVHYPDCVVPDTFRDVPGMDVKVTAEGTLSKEGFLDATKIMAKCPSKYEMQQKAAGGEAAPHEAIGMPVAVPAIEE
ncbi:MAG: hypothetical protein B6A08_03710 [Sorangiineae bacterium NIC37A_2]|jgi:cytochrome c-type biogenesis protein CcmE|nr:MAG: hypothetical protein B6A08_03710 [Sorangiineae bacterium NIC37A_2]